MNHLELLRHGTASRATALHNYATLGLEEGAKLERQVMFEVAKVMCEVHGHEDAYAMLINIADAAASGLPIENWEINLARQSAESGLAVPSKVTVSYTVPPAASATPALDAFKTLSRINKARVIVGAIGKAMTDRFFIGVLAGLLGGRQW